MNYVFNKKTYNSTMVYHTLYIYIYVHRINFRI